MLVGLMSDDDLKVALDGLAVVAEFIEKFTPVWGPDPDYADARARALEVLVHEAKVWQSMATAGRISLSCLKAATGRSKPGS